VEMAQEGLNLLKRLLISIVESKSIYHIQLRELFYHGSTLGEFKKAAGPAISVYTDFLKIINVLTLDRVGDGHVTNDLSSTFPSLESLYCELGVRLETLAFPPSLQNLNIQKGIPKTVLPQSLLLLHLEEVSCSENTILNLMSRIENDCPNLLELNINWILDRSEDPDNPEEIVLRVRQLGVAGFSSILISFN